jgi:hypothetical protein
VYIANIKRDSKTLRLDTTILEIQLFNDAVVAAGHDVHVLQQLKQAALFASGTAIQFRGGNL